MTADEIKAVLVLHEKWLRNESGGVNANLTNADLKGAILTNADLTNANLTGADLTNADLNGANLRYADMTGADLTYANLTNVNLTNAILKGADLTNAILKGANLTNADLKGADLTNAILKGAILPVQPVYTKICPEGAFIGWKKVRRECGEPAILKLQIPEDAQRVSSVKGRKCRASKVLVLEALGGAEGDVFTSFHDFSFIYKVGQVVEPRYPYNPTFLNDCESGIHFFITREEAKSF